MLKHTYTEVKYFFKDILKGLFNLYDWFSIIWKDRDWDYQYMFFIIKKKLQRYEREHNINNMFESQEQTLKYIRICIKLVDELIDNVDKEAEKFNLKYPNDFIYIPYAGEHTEYKDWSTLEKKYLNDKDESRKEELDALFSECIKKDRLRREKVKTLLFKILSTQIEFWWT